MSFDIACGVSGVPIASGDEAIVFVIEPCDASQPFRHNIQTHPEAIYRPVSLPIRALYMSNGDFEPIGNGIGRAANFVATLNAVLQEQGRGEQLADWGDFVELNHAGMKFPGKDFCELVDRPYHPYAVHRDIFAAAISSDRAIRLATDHVARVGMAMSERLREDEEFFARHPAEDRERRRDASLSNMARRFADDLSRPHIAHSRLVSVCAEMIPVAKAALAAKRSLSLDELPAASREAMVFSFAMSELNRSFAPAVYADEDFDGTLADLIHREAGKLLHKRRPGGADTPESL